MGLGQLQATASFDTLGALGPWSWYRAQELGVKGCVVGVFGGLGFRV